MTSCIQIITFYKESSFLRRENLWLACKNQMAATRVVLLFLVQFCLVRR